MSCFCLSGLPIASSQFTCICWSMQNCHITLQEHLQESSEWPRWLSQWQDPRCSHSSGTCHTPPDVDAKSGDWGRATRYQSPQLTRTGVVPGMSERPPSVEKVQFLPLCRWWCDQPDLVYNLVSKTFNTWAGTSPTLWRNFWSPVFFQIKFTPSNDACPRNTLQVEDFAN